MASPAETTREATSILDISIICVNWNSLDYLRDCIVSIYQYTHGLSSEIIVVDNASPEGNVDRLKEQFPDIIIIKAETNLGFARANNLGFLHSSGNYVLFLNPDTQLCGPAINTMLKEIQHLPDAGIVGCKLLNTDSSVQLTAIQKFPTLLNQVLDAEYLQLRWPHCRLWNIAPLFSADISVTRVDVISGACMLLRREVFDRVGMFSDDYFMYAEDIDLNVKVARAGLNNYYVSGAVIVHHGGKSSSQQNISHWSTIMKYRAMVQLFTKTRGPVYGLTYRTAIGCVAIVRLILLVAAYPLSKLVWNREAIRRAARKWRIILEWAVGFQDVALENK